MKKARLLALLLALLMLTGCAAAETASDPVVVKVGDHTLTLSFAQEVYEDLFHQYESSYAQNGLELTSEDAALIRDEAIDLVTTYGVMDVKVEELSLSNITEEEKAQLLLDAKVEYDEVVASFAEYYTISKEEAIAGLIPYGVTEESQYELMLKNLPYNKLLDSIVKDITVTDEAVAAEYQTYVDSDKATFENDVASYELYTNYYQSTILYVPSGYRFVKHILLGLPEDIAAKLTPADEALSTAKEALDVFNSELYALENVEESPEVPPRKAEEIQADIDAKTAEVATLQATVDEIRATILPALQPKLDEIKAKLTAGETFESLITAYGTDPGMTTSPDGYKVHKDSIIWDVDFRDASMALANIGDVSEPVLSGFGVHIIQYVGEVPSGAVPMSAEDTAALREQLLATAKQDAFYKQLDIWKGEYTIEAHPELVELHAIGEEHVDEPAPEATAETLAPEAATEAPVAEPTPVPAG